MVYKHYDDETNVESDWDVEYDPGYYKESKTSGHPDTWYEAEGEDLMVTSVTDEFGKDITYTISPSLMAQIEKACEVDSKEDPR